jgi:hypothetical protein
VAWRDCTCGRRFVPRTGSHRFCTPVCRERYKLATGKRTKQAKYGAEHRRIRAALDVRVQAGLESCTRCGEPIEPGTRWHLDHDDATGAHRGAAHASCNAAAGGAKSNLDARMRERTDGYLEDAGGRLYRRDVGGPSPVSRAW